MRKMENQRNYGDDPEVRTREELESDATEENGLLHLIKGQFSSLSEGQQRLARYILRHPEELALLTAAKLGEAVGLSESAVVRFAIRLGYTGYPEMQEEAQQIVRMRLAPIERLSAAQEEKDGISFLIEQALKNLKMTASGLSKAELDEVAQTLSSAQEVYVFGLRSSASMAAHLGFLLKHLHPKVTTLIHGGAELFEGLRDIGSEDVAVCICFPRYTKESIDALRFSKERGAKTITITDTVVSPTAEIADVTLACEIVSPSFYESFVSCVFVIEAIVYGIVNLNREKAMASLRSLEDVLKPRNLWVIKDSRNLKNE